MADEEISFDDIIGDLISGNTTSEEASDDSDFSKVFSNAPVSDFVFNPDVIGDEIPEDEWDEWDEWDESWGREVDDECGEEEEEIPIPLSQRTEIGGWDAKWKPNEFEGIAQRMVPAFSQETKLGLTPGDDCAIMRINDEQATVFTLDWFPPLVDDPYTFGAVSAAASLSNLYATGAKPMTALNIMALPCKLGVDEVGEVMRGGSDKVVEAGAFVVGGHSIDDADPKYGLAAFGVAHPSEIIRNENARPGDVLFCTKPLGTGIMNAAFRAEVETEETLQDALAYMMELNKPAAVAMEGLDVHAAVTISGLGLVGHLHVLLDTCEAAAEIDWDAVPMLDRAWGYVLDGIRSIRSRQTEEWANEFVDRGNLSDDDYEDRMSVLCDPQTSGGLLVAVSAQDADAYEQAFNDAAGRFPARVGRIIEGDVGRITIM